MKITFIGGGSYSWGPTLLGDLALSQGLVTVLGDSRCTQRYRTDEVYVAWRD